MCGKGALPVEHLAHWAEFWAKKRPRKIILGQNVWANFSGPRRRRGGHAVVPSGPAGCRGVWGRWPVGYLRELAPGSGCRWVVSKPNKNRRTPNPFCSADKGQMIREAIGPCSPRPPRAAAVVVLPNHLRCTGLVMNDVGTPFERWQCWVQRWGWVGRGGWHGWVHFCCRQPPDPMVNPFHGPSPRLCTRSGLQCLQTHPA